jgi:hypothetical protein
MLGECAGMAALLGTPKDRVIVLLILQSFRWLAALNMNLWQVILQFSV